MVQAAVGLLHRAFVQAQNHPNPRGCFSCERVLLSQEMPHRFADDIVLGFEHRADAERFLAELRDRLQQFGLELHAEKTRLIEFGPHAIANRKQRGEGKPDTFDFLGFTHMCERHRKTGSFIVRRKTSRKRMMAKPLWQRCHEPIATTGQWLGSVVQGDCNDHAVPGNVKSPWAPSGGG